jgi:hypothetical protein
MGNPSNTAVGGLADPSRPAASAFGLSMAALFMTIFGFVWLGWGFSVSPAFTDFSSSRTPPAARWITFYVAFLVLLALSIAALRKAKARMRSTSIERDEFWVRDGKKLKIISALEGTGSVIVVSLAVASHRTDLLAAGISLVVGMHFFPLARLMRFPSYYAAGIAIILCDLVSVKLLRSTAITLWAGVGTGTILWIMAVYALLRSHKSLRDVLPRRGNALSS